TRCGAPGSERRSRSLHQKVVTHHRSPIKARRYLKIHYSHRNTRKHTEVFEWLEPISIIGTCATEAMWDAGRGGEPEAICRYCEGSRQRDAPRAPRPLRGCGQDGRLLRCPA